MQPEQLTSSTAKSKREQGRRVYLDRVKRGLELLAKVESTQGKGQQEFALVDRPVKAPRPPKVNAFHEALRATVGSNQAVNIPLNGLPVDTMRARLSHAGIFARKTLNGKMRTMTSPDKQTLFVWVEKSFVESLKDNE